MINKNEVKYLAMSVIFASIFFLFLLPQLILKNNYDKINPLLQFLIFNIGFFIMLQIILKARAIGKFSINVKGALGLLLLFTAFDIFTPPLLVTPAGELVSSPILSGSSSDYVAGYIANLFGLSGIYVFIFTYIFIPFILLTISSILIPDFVKRI